MMAERFVAKEGKLLRGGYTTGSCAAAAAKAAALLLLTGTAPAAVTIGTPAGISLTLPVLQADMTANGSASCAIRKDGGDDPDATDGLLIYATLTRQETGLTVDGGEGVGRVTKPGLDQPVGAAAINSTPRRMIAQSVEEACRSCGYAGGLCVILSIPGGEETAKRTFNPRMGIEGGLSIVGTTGLVDPMSAQALVDTVKLELTQLAAGGQRNLLLSPGNYGSTFAQEALHLDTRQLVTCSNFIGAALDGAVEKGFTHVLLVGHIGKLVKLSIGITDTHSKAGDGRIEALLRWALEAEASLPLLRAIDGCVTTDAALLLLQEAGLLASVMRLLGEKIQDCLLRRVPPQMEIGFVCFTNAPALPGVLTQSPNAASLLTIWRNEI